MTVDETVPARSREQQVLDRIERVRRRPARVREERITLAHGAGGKATHTLIEAMFLEAFRNPELEQLGDSAVLDVLGGRLAMTTDSYVVSPLFFPGGCIGDLAVNGTVNDLAVSGARPLALSAAFVLEEGFEVEALGRVIDAMATAAAEAGVTIVTGDTKVVQRGKGDALLHHDRRHRCGGTRRPTVSGSGTGRRRGDRLRSDRRPRDHDHAGARRPVPRRRRRVRHGAAVGPRLRVARRGSGHPVLMRDATRGGVATVLNEVASSSGVAVIIDEAAVPVRAVVAGACELLGLDPLYVACEGRMVAVVPPGSADAALDAMRSASLGRRGRGDRPDCRRPAWARDAQDRVRGTRIVDMLVGDPLPRIC